MVRSSTSRKGPSVAKPKEPVTAGVEAASIGEPDVTTVAAPKTEAPAVSTPRRPVDLFEGAKGQLKELTGYPIDSVSGFAKSGEGWTLTIAVVELSRIPAATDVLAEYVVSLDAAGNIESYRRGQRYNRGDVGEAE